MLRFHINCDPVSMTANTVYDIFTNTCFTEDLRSLDAMFLRIFFKIDIVKQSHDAPEIRVIAESQILCKPSHYTFHSQRMLDMKWFFVMRLDQ